MEQQNKERKGKRCYNCTYFKRHYTIGQMKFNREKTGYCNRKDSIVSYQDTCEDWYSSQYTRRRSSENTVKTMNETIAALVEVTSLMREDVKRQKMKSLACNRSIKRLKQIEQEIDNLEE